MTPAQLRGALRTVLARLELVSSAPTPRYDPDGGGGGGEGIGPSGGSSPVERFALRLGGIEAGLRRRLAAAEAVGGRHERALEVRIAAAWHHDARCAVLADAEQTLADLTGRTGEAPVRRDAAMDAPEGIDDAVREDAPGKPAAYVASHLGLSVFVVRRIYVAAGLDPMDGSALTTVADDRAGRVAELQAKGMTSRQIAAVLHLHQTQVARLLQRG